jgi:hypothetical protein
MRPGSVVVGYLDPGTWSAVFGLSLRDLCLHDALVSHRVVRDGGKELRARTAAGGIPAGRNQVVRDFLDTTDGEYLFMVDSDMGFAPDTVDRLVGSADTRRPVMGGLCFAHKRHPDGPGEFAAERFVVAPTLYEYVEVDGDLGFRPAMDWPRGEVVRVAGTGAACLLIHREALKKVRARRGDTWFDPVTHPTALKGGPRTFSEDLSFCVRLQEVGVPVHVDTSVRTCHDKGGAVLDQAAYDRDRALAQLERDLTSDVA